MTRELIIREGQILTGPLFNEPMRVETYHSGRRREGLAVPRQARFKRPGETKQ